jgi:arginyl-tRNA synthetase
MAFLSYFLKSSRLTISNFRVFPIFAKKFDMLSAGLRHSIFNVIQTLYQAEIRPSDIQLEETNKDFEGDFTFVVFPYLKFSKKSPEATAQEIGEQLQSTDQQVKSCNVVKGFLNITLYDSVWASFINEHYGLNNYGTKQAAEGSQPIVVEYSSPNTNKPLHLGHIRNNLIGQSVSRILAANGHIVKQVNLINDRGIHICKTMLAQMKWGADTTPEMQGIKGDKYVGDLYVRFEKELQKELQSLIAAGMSEDEAHQKSSLMEEARQLLILWEENDPKVRALWKTMNEWVMQGFERTYERMNIRFDTLYFESGTYLLGKEIVLKGLKDGAFIRKSDQSVWADLRDDGLDEKILLRSDGTSVYITQDMGSAVLRQQDYTPDKMIYVVGNEQNYHFQVLKLVLSKAGFNWADNIEHLSYGMVELPEGKMKSREGKVVDADDLMDEMFSTARTIAQNAGKVISLPEDQADEILEMIAQGALKYFILRVDAKKNMIFNPEESIDFNGNTGPFVQYTHARIMSLLDKSASAGLKPGTASIEFLSPAEKELAVLLSRFPKITEESAETLNPSVIAQYAYDLAKAYNTFYQNHPVLKEPDEQKRLMRLNLSLFTANILDSSFFLLGIDMPGIM